MNDFDFELKLYQDLFAKYCLEDLHGTLVNKQQQAFNAVKLYREGLAEFFNTKEANTSLSMKVDNLQLEIAPKSTEKYLSWDDAVEYCKNLVVDGKTGWRLPTKTELNQMYKNKDSMSFGEEFDPTWYCSASEQAATDAWCQCFSSSNQCNFYYKTNSCCVRAVRRES